MDEQTKLPRCIAYGVQLDPLIDSEAHVVPNALGGRLKPRGLLSASANARIGHCIEASFFANYQSVISLVDGKRQRGDHPSFQVKGPDGRTYLYKSDHSLSPAPPTYKPEHTETGEVIHIVARTMAELRTLLGRVTKKFPEFDVEAAIAGAQVVSEPSPQVKFELSVGLNVYFPMAYVMAAQFNAYGRLPVHPGFPGFVRSLVKGEHRTACEHLLLGASEPSLRHNEPRHPPDHDRSERQETPVYNCEQAHRPARRRNDQRLPRRTFARADVRRRREPRTRRLCRCGRTGHCGLGLGPHPRA